MFFEGSEKKLEVITSQEAGSLRKLGREFWAETVRKAQADILTTTSNECCDAYLLSESSLFVWDDRFLMLTCGTTTLVDAFVYLLDKVPEKYLLFASYQRKNEYQPHLQKTMFEEDLAHLREHVSGKAYRLGHMDSHHNFIFHTDRSYRPGGDDRTLELLMYHITGDVAHYLRSEGQTLVGIRERLRLGQILPSFTISDWLFEPFGYSMNAIRGDRYATCHITPQKDSSYVSFETNLSGEGDHILMSLLGVLQPVSWDFIGFNHQAAISVNDFTCLTHCELPMKCGYNMTFNHYQHKTHQLVQVEELL